MRVYRGAQKASPAKRTGQTLRVAAQYISVEVKKQMTCLRFGEANLANSGRSSTGVGRLRPAPCHSDQQNTQRARYHAGHETKKNRDRCRSGSGPGRKSASKGPAKAAEWRYDHHKNASSTRGPAGESTLAALREGRASVLSDVVEAALWFFFERRPCRGQRERV